MTDKPSVLFVCVHNAGRSQMAAAYLAHLSGGAVEVRSAGSAPADQVNTAAVEAMAEEGIDIAAEVPKVLTTDAVRESDVVITMGCGDTCPIFPGKRYEDWELDDPAGKGVEAVRPIRDQIKARILTLLDELDLPAATRGLRLLEDVAALRRQGQGVADRGEPLGDGAVVDPRAAPAPGDQAGLPEQPQVVARGGGALADALGDVAGAHLLGVQQHGHDLDPRGVGQRLEHGGQLLRSLVRDRWLGGRAAGREHGQLRLGGRAGRSRGGRRRHRGEPTFARRGNSMNFEEILPRVSKFCFDERRNTG
jgi:protein-tyrosine-phosphatase